MFLSIRCAVCPEGADCEQEGSTMDTIAAAEGYFMGIEESGTAFFSCLTDGCWEAGECDPRYTGRIILSTYVSLVVNCFL